MSDLDHETAAALLRRTSWRTSVTVATIIAVMGMGCLGNEPQPPAPSSGTTDKQSGKGDSAAQIKSEQETTPEAEPAVQLSEEFSWSDRSVEMEMHGARPWEVHFSELLAAHSIVIGCFAKFEKGEPAIGFVVDRPLKGDADRARRDAPTSEIEVSKSGGLVLKENVNGKVNPNGFGDVRAKGLWFFGLTFSERQELRAYEVGRYPVELTDGFAALLAGKQPDLVFELLQQLDLDRQRAALEELFAKRPPDVVAKLHALALQPDSEVAVSAAWVLKETRLLDPEKFWGKWSNLPGENALPDLWGNLPGKNAIRDELIKRDVRRMKEDMQKAIASEKDTGRLMNLLYYFPNEGPEKLELALSYLDHADDKVRSYALDRVWDIFWSLNYDATKSPEGAAKLASLGKRIVPLLEARKKVETYPATQQQLARMLAAEDGTPFLLRMPPARAPEPIPPYSETEELDRLLQEIDGVWPAGGFMQVAAGREIAEHFFEAGFAKLKARTESKTANAVSIYESLGYVHNPKVFDYLVEFAHTPNVPESRLAATILAIGLQNEKRSLEVIKELVQTKAAEKYPFENMSSTIMDALAAVSNPEALDFLKTLEPRIVYPAKVRYLRARALHGDAWAIGELLQAFEKPSASKFLSDGWCDRHEVICSLLTLDAPEVTTALKQEVQETWPMVIKNDFFGRMPNAYLENYAGGTHRNAPLGEIARRDPQWLGDLALRMMASNSMPARGYGEDVFQQLTGRKGLYKHDAFAGERAVPLHELETWWAAHRQETREQWLIEYFREKGISIQRFDKGALPMLARALEEDLDTHNLAVEQISVICQKCFGSASKMTYQGQERNTVRVLGWLNARGFLELPNNPKKSGN